MRRVVLALALMVGIGSMALMSGPVAAQDGVAFTIHAASCPVDPAESFYDACHDNALEGAVFTLNADGTTPVEITSGADGVGEGLILAGLESAENAVLTSTAPGGWIYCKDQIGGFVLADGALTGETVLGTILTTQWIICDVYQYDAPLPVVVANG